MPEDKGTDIGSEPRTKSGSRETRRGKILGIGYAGIGVRKTAAAECHGRMKKGMRKRWRLRLHLHPVRFEQIDNDADQLGIELVVLRTAVEVVARLVLRDSVADGVALQQP